MCIPAQVQLDQKIQPILEVIGNKNNLEVIRLIEQLPDKSVTNEENKIIMGKVEEMLHNMGLNESASASSNVRKMYTMALGSKLKPTDAMMGMSPAHPHTLPG